MHYVHWHLMQKILALLCGLFYSCSTEDSGRNQARLYCVLHVALAMAIDTENILRLSLIDLKRLARFQPTMQILGKIFIFPIALLVVLGVLST